MILLWKSTTAPVVTFWKNGGGAIPPCSGVPALNSPSLWKDWRRNKFYLSGKYSTCFFLLFCWDIFSFKQSQNHRCKWNDVRSFTINKISGVGSKVIRGIDNWTMLPYLFDCKPRLMFFHHFMRFNTFFFSLTKGLDQRLPTLLISRPHSKISHKRSTPAIAYNC